MALEDQKTTLGTAQWADPDVFSAQNRYKTGHIWMGRSPVSGHALGGNDDRHICLVGGSRGGKGTSFILPNILAWPGSIVVLDPKGENTNVAASRRGNGSDYCEGLGQKVFVLDPFGCARLDNAYRASFNPLDALDPEHPEVIDQAAMIADAIIVVREDSKDPFWEEAARAMVRALILHVITTKHLVGQRSLLTVREFLTRGDWRGVKKLEEMEHGKVPTAQQLLWQGVLNNLALNGVISGAGENFASMLRQNPKGFDGVLQTAITNTDFMDSPGIRECLCKSDFKLSDLKTDPKGISLFLSLPQYYMSTHHRWLRMMTSLIVAEMERVKQQPACGHRVLMMLDEFAGLKYMQTIENAIAQIAGYGVKLFIVLQSIDQLKGTYKDRWATFLTNAGLKIFIDVDDNETVGYISKMLGDTEVLKETETSNITTTESESETTGTSTSETESINRSRAVGRSYSETEGNSEGYTEGTSESQTTGESKSKTKGSNRSIARSFSFGFNRSRSSGRNRSKNRGWNESRGTNWGSSSGGSSGWGSGGYNSGSNYGSNSGGNHSSGDSGGSSDGTSDQNSSGSSMNLGRTNTTGTNRSFTVNKNTSQTFGLNKSKSFTTNNSRTTGETETETEGEGRSKTTGTSASKTIGGSKSTAEGTGQQYYHRPLITPDELRLTLALIKDREHELFPGYALVVPAGEKPTAVRRCFYFEDEYFIGWYDPHPDHPDNAPPKFVVELPLDGITVYEDEEGTFQDTVAKHLPSSSRLSIMDWQVEAGQPVEQFQLLASIGRFEHAPSKYYSEAIQTIESEDLVYEPSQQSFKWKVYSRFGGKLKSKSTSRSISSVGVLETNRRRLHFEWDGNLIEPPTVILADYLREVGAYASNLELEALRQAQEKAERERLEREALQRAEAERLAKLREEQELERQRREAERRAASELSEKLIRRKLVIQRISLCCISLSIVTIIIYLLSVLTMTLYVNRLANIESTLYKDNIRLYWSLAGNKNDGFLENKSIDLVDYYARGRRAWWFPVFSLSKPIELKIIEADNNKEDRFILVTTYPSYQRRYFQDRYGAMQMSTIHLGPRTGMADIYHVTLLNEMTTNWKTTREIKSSVIVQNEEERLRNDVKFEQQLPKSPEGSRILYKENNRRILEWDVDYNWTNVEELIAENVSHFGILSLAELESMIMSEFSFIKNAVERLHVFNEKHLSNYVRFPDQLGSNEAIEKLERALDYRFKYDRRTNHAYSAEFGGGRSEYFKKFAQTFGSFSEADTARRDFATIAILVFQLKIFLEETLEIDSPSDTNEQLADIRILALLEAYSLKATPDK